MKTILCALALSLGFSPLHAGWLDALGLGKNPTNATPASATAVGLAALSQGQVADALKQALGDGLQHAVAQLGRNDGFLTNLNVKIPLPDKLKSVEKTLRVIHQDKLADEFVATMNHAAELAVPAAASVFGNAVKQMNIEDAKAVLTGTNDAATQFFRRATQTNLYAIFYPIVQSATAKAGVTAAYKNMLGKVNTGNALGGLLNRYAGPEALDVDAYVTSKALDGLFKLVAEEELRIRQNPAARKTDLLKQVFGAVGK